MTLCGKHLVQASACHCFLGERIDGIHDSLQPQGGGKGPRSAHAKGKKRTNGDFRGLWFSHQTHLSSCDGEAPLFSKISPRVFSRAVPARVRSALLPGY